MKKVSFGAVSCTINVATLDADQALSSSCKKAFLRNMNESQGGGRDVRHHSPLNGLTATGSLQPFLLALIPAYTSCRIFSSTLMRPHAPAVPLSTAPVALVHACFVYLFLAITAPVPLSHVL